MDNNILINTLRTIANDHKSANECMILAQEALNNIEESDFEEVQSELNKNFNNIRMGAEHTLFLNKTFKVLKLSQSSNANKEEDGRPYCVPVAEITTVIVEDAGSKTLFYKSPRPTVYRDEEQQDNIYEVIIMPNPIWARIKKSGRFTSNKISNYMDFELKEGDVYLAELHAHEETFRLIELIRVQSVFE